MGIREKSHLAISCFSTSLLIPPAAVSFLDTSPCKCRVQTLKLCLLRIASDMHQSYKSPNMNSKSTCYITFQELSWNLSPQFKHELQTCAARSIPVASFGVAHPQPMMPPDIHRWSSPSPIHMAGCLADEMWTGQSHAKSCELHNLDMKVVKVGRRVMARNTSKFVLYSFISFLFRGHKVITPCMVIKL